MNSYKLMNHIMLRMMKITAPIFCALFVIETILFYNTSTNLDFYYYRFEQALAKSGLGVMFWIAFFGILGVMTFILLSYYWGGKSIYTILSLPVKPSGMVLSFLVPCIINIFILFALQLTVIILFGLWLPAFFGEWMTVCDYMHNYILLGVIRYTPTSFLFPLSGIQLIKLLLLTITPPIVLLYSFFSIMARRYYFFVIVGLWLLFMQDAISESVGFAHMVVKLILCILLTGFLLWSTIRSVKERKIG